MSVALYFDHNVRFSIALGLWLRGVDVLIARDDGFDEADDPTVLAHATELGLVAFTNDDDFLAVAHQWLEVERPLAGVIYVHQLRLTVGQTIADLEIIAKAGNPEDLWKQGTGQVARLSRFHVCKPVGPTDGNRRMATTTSRIREPWDNSGSAVRELALARQPGGRASQIAQPPRAPSTFQGHEPIVRD